MAPNTRQTHRENTPPKHKRRTEWNTPQKSHFFSKIQAYSSLRAAAKAEHIPFSTAQRWAKQRKDYGSPSLRRTRPLSNKLGRREKLSPEIYKKLVSPSRNPVRNQLYEAQIQYYNLDITKRTLQYGLKRHTRNGARYKMPYVNKKLSPKNLKSRVAYGKRHMHKKVRGFWEFVEFTDEFHVDPTELGREFTLREEGTRLNEANIQQRPKLKGIKFHVAGWITYHSRIKKLIFYNEALPKEQQPRRPPKPWRRPNWSDNRWQQALNKWEASLPPKEEVIPKGNSITQEYYCEHLLPHYINAINKARLQSSKHRGISLVEDGDPSHSMRKAGLAAKMRKEAWITNIEHPPNSPDLNPIEGIWLYIKGKLRKEVWSTMDELKALIQRLWDEMDQDQVRSRIREMPDRCRRLVESGGLPIKSELW